MIINCYFYYNLLDLNLFDLNLFDLNLFDLNLLDLNLLDLNLLDYNLFDFYTMEANIDELVCIAAPECSICFESIGHTALCVTKCKHMFHTGCINKWCKTNNSCPLCRTSPLFESTKTNTIHYDSNLSHDYDYEYERYLLDNNFNDYNFNDYNLNNDNLNNDNLNIENDNLNIENDNRVYNNNIRNTLNTIINNISYDF